MFVMKMRDCFLALLFLCSCVMHPFAAAAHENMPQLHCTSVLMEAETGLVLAGENPDDVLPIGSQTKLMTVYLTAAAIEEEKLTPDTLVSAPAAVAEQKGAVVWLEPGEKMSVSDLLKAVIIGNANDAAVTLAYAVSGSEAQFVLDMNAAAFSLGMHTTRFADATGQRAENQSCAKDLGLLCRALLAFDFLSGIFGTWRDFLRDGTTELVSENTLTRTYEGLLGFKAGHGEQCGFTLAAAAERDGLRCIAVVLGCEDKDARFSLAKTLLAKGFAGYMVTTPDFSTEFLKPVAVRHGMDRAVMTDPRMLVSVAIPKGEAVSCLVVLPAYVEAPVKKGQKLGVAAFYCGDTLLYEAELCADASVARRGFQDSFALLLENLFK